MMNAMLFCEECGAANSGQLPYCFACHTPLAPPPSAPAISDVAATFTQVPVGNSKVAYQLAEPEETRHPVGPLPPGFVLNKRYKIIKQIGQGGFGIVYKAHDKKRFNKLVAVKQINLDNLSPRDIIQATDSYNREVKLQSVLHHKYIPTVYQHFTDPKHWYLIMKFVKGETLEEYLQRVPAGKLPEREVLRIGIQLCKVLDYLHTKHGIIFRDVKPANIMRTPQGHLYLIDFGIAREYVKGKGKDTIPLGSPGYAAPEQYGISQTSPQTDIYGLGATLLTLLTGTDLSDDTTTGAQPPPLSQKIQSLLDSMLEREVYKRPATMEAVQAHLLRLKYGFGGRFLYNNMRSIIIGTLTGAIPYLLYISVFLAQIQPTLGFLRFVSHTSSLVGVAIFATGLILVAEPKRQLIGACILITMIICAVIFTLGHVWPQWYFG